MVDGYPYARPAGHSKLCFVVWCIGPVCPAPQLGSSWMDQEMGIYSFFTQPVKTRRTKVRFDKQRLMSRENNANCFENGCPGQSWPAPSDLRDWECQNYFCTHFAHIDCQTYFKNMLSSLWCHRLPKFCTQCVFPFAHPFSTA